MSQKIVITANMNRSSGETVPEVTYQWHWRRILAAALLVALTLVVVAYSLMGSVNAEQNDTSAGQQTELDSPALTTAPDNTDEPLLTEHKTASSAPISEPQTAKKSDVSQPVIVAKNIEPVVTEKQELVVQEAKTPSAKLEKHAPSPEVVNVAESEDNFAETAHIASVALGAKIDTDKVSRAVLTRNVVEREPINVFKADIRLTEFADSLTFFSELKNLQGQRIRHIWRFENQVMASIELDVTSPRYRTYSNKHILPEQTGQWRVDVVDEQDHLLAQKEFRILAD